MSNNTNQQNRIEQHCLDILKDNLSKEMCFGLSDVEYVELKERLKKAKPNGNSNDFPDFICDEGFIEHFAVTSSSETRKGSKEKAETVMFEKRNCARFSKRMEKKDAEETIKHFSNRKIKGHSHDNIIKSIKKNWKKHIESYDNFSGCKEHGIFLLEYGDQGALETMEKTAKGYKHYWTYRLNTDKELLKWLYDYKNKVEYILFMSQESIEVIKIDQILNILDSLPEGLYCTSYSLQSDRYIGETIKFE